MSVSWSVPLSGRIAERAQRARVSAESLWRLGRGWLRPAELDILGSYNTSNVGDRAFAVCLGRIARDSGIRVNIQDYSRYQRSRHAERLVIGGGGVIGPQNRGLQLCAEHRRSFGRTVSVIGVSGALSADDLSPALRDLLSRARFLSARDQKTQRNLAQTLGREVTLQPDIAFALLDCVPTFARDAHPARPGTIGINLNPVLASRGAHGYAPNAQPSPWFAQRLPEVAAVYSQVAPAYVDLLRACVRHHTSQGKHVVAVPFAAEDAAFAEAVLAGSGAELAPFDGNPESVLARVARCETFIATRFHAHVFALLLRVPLISLAYSEKCSLLVRELWPDAASPGPLEWVREAARCREHLSNLSHALVLDEARWLELRRAALAGTRLGIHATLE